MPARKKEASGDVLRSNSRDYGNVRGKRFERADY